MKPPHSADYDERDEEIIKLLEDLGSVKSNYPPELLNATRAAFLAQVDRLSSVDAGEELSAKDREIVELLGKLRSAPVEYPPDLFAARRSAFLRQMERAGGTSVLDRIRALFAGIRPGGRTMPRLRISLAIASLLAAVFLGSLLFNPTEQSLQPAPSPVVAARTLILPSATGDVALAICPPDDQTPPCLPPHLPPSQDLADPGNGAAKPAVSKDARAGQEGVHAAAYVNDGQRGASWVSNSPNSWIKIDLGQVTTFNAVSLQKGNPVASEANDPGQFVIAVAISDAYADGDSSSDYVEYAQVFRSEQTNFSGRVSHTETIQTRFAPVQARFIKITFENAGAAIDEVGVFMVPPPELAAQPTRTAQTEATGTAVTPTIANTLLARITATSVSTGTPLPGDTVVPTLTNTSPPSYTTTALPTNTLAPVDTATAVPTEPLPSNTPIPLPTVAPPTAVPPTAVPPTIPPPPVSTDPIVVTGNGQTVTFTCNGNAAEVRGHANTVTLLGSCSSITVTGNGNRVYWESGSPVITNRGKDNIISQL